jgi:hypothetical protein
VTVVLIQSEPWGWGWTGVAVALAAGAVARLAWWRDPPPVAVTWLALGGCLASLAFLLPPYFELARGLSPVRSGLLMLTLTVPAAGAWWIVARPATARLASPATTLAGLGCAVVAMLALAALDADSSYRLPILALAVAGTGLGLAAGSVGLAALGPPAETLLAGAAIGAALVLGFAGALFQNEQAAEREAGASFEQALADGVGLAALGLAAVLLAGAAAAWRGSRAGGATRSASAARRAAGS